MADQHDVYSYCEFSVKDIANRLKHQSCLQPRFQFRDKWYTPICHDDEDMLFYQEIVHEGTKWINQGFFGDFLVKLQGGQYRRLKFNAETEKMNIFNG